MKNVNLQMARAAAAVFGNLPSDHGKLHQTYGISRAEWTLLTSDRLWQPGEAREAHVVLDKVLSASLTIAGLAQITLPAQYVAGAIALHVNPLNWLSACYAGRQYIDGLVAVVHDEEPARQYVTAERLFALVLYTWETVLECPETPSQAAKGVISDG